MADMNLQEPEPLRIIKSLQDKYDSADEAQHLRPIYLMALGMAAIKILELEKQKCTVDAIEVRLDQEIEDMLVKQAHDILTATKHSFPWTKAVIASAIGGFGTLVLAASVYALLKHLDSVGLLASFW